MSLKKTIIVNTLTDMLIHGGVKVSAIVAHLFSVGDTCIVGLQG